jgi:hypothetical protein
MYLSIALWTSYKLGSDLPSFGEIVRRALSLDPEIIRILENAPNGLIIAATIVALAGFSEALGQSLVLFVNRVSPRRFSLALFLSAGSHVAGYLVWTASIWLVGVYVFGRSVPYTTAARAVGLAYAPQLFGFFILTPYIGSFIGMVLAIWTLLATLLAVQVALQLSLWQAAAASILGWLLIQAWRRTLGRPILALSRWFQRRAVGVSLDKTVQEVPEHPLSDRIRQWLENRGVGRDVRGDSHD